MNLYLQYKYLSSRTYCFLDILMWLSYRNLCFICFKLNFWFSLLIWFLPLVYLIHISVPYSTPFVQAWNLSIILYASLSVMPLFLHVYLVTKSIYLCLLCHHLCLSYYLLLHGMPKWSPKYFPSIHYGSFQHIFSALWLVIFLKHKSGQAISVFN